MIKLRTFIITGIYFGFILIGQAHADDYGSYFQISCVPELQYFAIRSFVISIPPSAYKAKDLDEKYGIYTAERLKANPYVCKVPAEPQSTTPLVARVEAIATAQTSLCGSGMVRVTINDHDVGLISAEACQGGRTITSQIHASLIGDSLSIRRCDLEFDTPYPELQAMDNKPRPVKANCRAWSPFAK